jgi:hypothetical protein
MVDFGVGPTGLAGTVATYGGVTVNVAGAAGAQLYRWNTNFYNHFDAGLGVLSPGERLNAAEPELDKAGAGGQEWLRVTSTVPMTGIWFTSVNNKANLDIYPSIYPAGFKLNVTTESCQGVGGPRFSCYLPFLVPTWVAWVTSGGGANDNYALVWGVDTKTPSVPEPGSLMLLGIGLVGIGNKLRRR